MIDIAEETLGFLKKDAEKREKVREELASTNAAMVEQLKRIADSSEGMVRALLAQNAAVVVELDAEGNIMWIRKFQMSVPSHAIKSKVELKNLFIYSSSKYTR